MKSKIMLVSANIVLYKGQEEEGRPTEHGSLQIRQYGWIDCLRHPAPNLSFHIVMLVLNLDNCHSRKLSLVMGPDSLGQFVQ
ncbi:hypothetical protein KQX54_011041 [Cotesia glomerata]|uniref:Uncharacterized protein n=1 Tax=Cotesia glomerata TaxID=32391 RepID=A0AAV7I7I3_COTGL|nr:hypothetical protein KQX54_011041 [Cotesia glomerata]